MFLMDIIIVRLAEASRQLQNEMFTYFWNIFSRKDMKIFQIVTVNCLAKIRIISSFFNDRKVEKSPVIFLQKVNTYRHFPLFFPI